MDRDGARMRIGLVFAGIGVLAGITAAQADAGGFFKNLFNGGGGSGSSAPIGAPLRAYDPSEVYCPAVTIADGGAMIQAGPVGDTGHLRHQLTFGQISRECTGRENGSIGVKVGVEIRALLGPSGQTGTFDAPLTFSTRFNGTVLSTRSRHVAVAVPAGAVQGVATAIESDLTVPADQVVGYEIVVALGGQGAKPVPRSAKRTKSAVSTSATPAETPATGQ